MYDTPGTIPSEETAIVSDAYRRAKSGAWSRESASHMKGA